MKETLAKNGADIGQIYLQKIREYLEVTIELPLQSDGSINLTEIAKSAGIPRQSLYKNPAIRQLIEPLKNYKQTIPDKQVGNKLRKKTIDGEAKPTSKSIELREKNVARQIHQLEQKNAVLFSENMELRRQIKELKMEIAGAELVIESGRRIIF